MTERGVLKGLAYTILVLSGCYAIDLILHYPTDPADQLIRAIESCKAMTCFAVAAGSLLVASRAGKP